MPAMSSPTPAQASLLTVAAEGGALVAVTGAVAKLLGVPLLSSATPGEAIRALAAQTLAYLVARVTGLLVQRRLHRRESLALSADSAQIGRRIAEKLSHRSE